jgi:hypothetical protein
MQPIPVEEKHYDEEKGENNDIPSVKGSCLAYFMRLYSRNTVVISFLKFAVIVIFSLSLNQTWTACGLPLNDWSSYHHCTDPRECEIGDCHTHIRSPYVTFDLEGGKSGHECRTNSVSTLGFSGHGIIMPLNGSFMSCSVYVDNSFVCSAWLVTSLGLMLANLFHLLYQLYSFYVFSDFDPQQTQILNLPVVMNILYGRDFYSLKRHYPYLLPRNSILGLFEMLAIVFALLEAYCNDDAIYCYTHGIVAPFYQQSLFIFSVVIIFEIFKVNIILFLNYGSDDPDMHWLKKKIYGSVNLFRLDLMILYSLIILCQAMVSALSVIFIFPFFYWTEGSDAMKKVYDESMKSAAEAKESKISRSRKIKIIEGNHDDHVLL